ncbi:MAG: A24 family peptidase [Cypionkella sp.]
MTPLFELVALAFFPLTVIYAGIGDLATMRIPNWLVMTMLLGYVVLAPLAGFSLFQMALGLATGCAVFFLTIGAFAFGWIGGGDVKLMSVAALWLGLPQLAAFLLWTSLSGGVLTLALLLYRSMPLPEAVATRIGWASRLYMDKKRVPYGVAIASASLIVFISTPWMAPLR